MRGSNEIMLNEATMIAAVQLYLDSKFRDGESPLVTAIKAKQGDYVNGKSDAIFMVTITEQSAECPKIPLEVRNG